MARREGMGRGHSRRDFTRKARGVHPKNLMNFNGPMRGGIRL